MTPRPILCRVAAVLVVLAVLTLGAACGDGGRASDLTTPAGAADGLVDIGAGLRGPEGLAATVYASGVPGMSAFATDPGGRLWIATADYQDTGADAVYLVAAAGDPPVAVVDGLHTALGLLWLGDELYVSSRGRVDAYGGFYGNRFARQRTVATFPAGAGQNGGLALGPDGRIRLGISAPCDHCVPESEWSASVVSFATDGSDLRIEARGIRAPIALAYVPGTDDLLVTMNHRDDLGEATPGDWLGLVPPGQDWGFPDCPGADATLGDGGCTGAPGPTAVLDPHAAVSGLAIVTGQLGPSVGAAAVVAEWKLGIVQRVSLAGVAGGAATGTGTSAGGYATTVAPFLSGFESPMPVHLAADGALLVGDWARGTVYRVAS
jgi:glucose/arabinose dehydrogenase